MQTTLRKSINLIISCVVILTMVFPNLQVTPVSAQTKSPNGIQREYNPETGSGQINTRPVFKEELLNSIKTKLNSPFLKFNSGGHVLGFTAHGMYVASGRQVLNVNFVGADQIEPQTGQPVGMKGTAETIYRVSYPELWQGISLQYSASSGSIYTTTYTVSPNAHPADIRLRYNTPVTLKDNGTLSVQFESGEMTESAPIAWQDIQGKRLPVAVSFQMDGQEVSFDLGQYDPQYPLTIDPSLNWNTFWGGKGYDVCSDIFVDDLGYIYVAGASWAYYLDYEGRYNDPK